MLFWFAFPWRLRMLSNFVNVSWPFENVPWEFYIYLSTPVFDWIILYFDVYVEVFEPLGVGFCAWIVLWIYLQALHVDIQLCQHHLLKMLFSHYNILALLSIKQVFIDVWINVMGTSIQFHWSTCLFLCQYQAIFIIVSL